MEFTTTAVVAFLASLLATPLVRLLARRLEILDRPDKHRKLHKDAIPLGGGIAVLLGFTVAISIVFAAGLAPPDAIPDIRFLAGFGLAIVTISLVGLVDDRFVLRGRQKLLGQIVACSILVLAGLRVEQIQIFGHVIRLGLLANPAAFLWMLGAINALNLIDGIDGLATSVGIVLSVALAIMSLMTGHSADALIAIGLAGSLAGFLMYNCPPASIFLGDSGSMLIGLVLGVIALRSSVKGAATPALVAPALAVWAVPIFDVSMAILRRKLTGRSIYSADRAHLHHKLLQRGFSGVATVVLIVSLCCVTATGALISVYLRNQSLALIGVAVVVCSLVLARFFGHGECLLLARRLKHLSLSMLPRRADQRVRAHLQGSREWDHLWNTLTDFAVRFDLSSVQLNVTLPMIHEEYHASWNRKQRHDESAIWQSDIPLVVQNMNVGRIRINGVCRSDNVCLWMGELIAGLKPFEEQMVELVRDHLSLGARSPEIQEEYLDVETPQVVGS